MPHILKPLLFIVPHVANVLGLREIKKDDDDDDDDDDCISKTNMELLDFDTFVYIDH